MVANCVRVAAVKSLKIHRTWGCPTTDIRAKSEDIITILKRSKRLASWMWQNCIYLGASLFLTSPLIRAVGQTEDCGMIPEKSWPRTITVKYPSLASKNRHKPGVVD